MISRASTTNLSNMNAISEEIIGANTVLSEDIKELAEEQWKITKFETTPPMSTYIVAVANGEFEYLESSVKMPLSGKTLPLRIYGMQPCCNFATQAHHQFQRLRMSFTRRNSLLMSRRQLFLSTRRFSTSSTLCLSWTPWWHTTSMQVLVTFQPTK